VREGRLKYCYNFFGIDYYTVEAACEWNSRMTAAGLASAVR
jgi:hypothetical protein